MNQSSKSFCASCGVARTPGNTCDYCGRYYVEPIAGAANVARITALPSHYKITKNKKGSVITWRWAKNSAWMLIPFALVWLAMAFPIAIDYFAEPGSLPVQLLPMAVGVGLLCHAIMKLINKTSIFASRQSLYIKHHPIPWSGKFRIATDNIEQVFVSRIQRSNKESSWHAPALQLISKDGQRHELLRGKREAEFSDFESLRLVILKALNIEPQQVAGAHDSFS